MPETPPPLRYDPRLDSHKMISIALRALIFCRKMSVQNSFVRRTIFFLFINFVMCHEGVYSAIIE